MGHVSLSVRRFQQIITKFATYSDNTHTYNSRFRNKCDIVEEPNSPSKHGIRVKFLCTNQKLC